MGLTDKLANAFVWTMDQFDLETESSKERSKMSSYPVIRYVDPPTPEVERILDGLCGRIAYGEYSGIAEKLWKIGWMFIPCSQYSAYNIYYIQRRPRTINETQKEIVALTDRLATLENKMAKLIDSSGDSPRKSPSTKSPIAPAKWVLNK